MVLDGGQVALPSHPDLSIDAVRFRALLAQAAAHGHPTHRLCDTCIAALTEATTLYTGAFLTGFALAASGDFEAWQTYQAESLPRELAAALAQLTGVHAQAGRRQYRLVIEYARRWVAVDPQCEPAHRALMRLYVATGDRSAALQQYATDVRLAGVLLSRQRCDGWLVASRPEWARPYAAQNSTMLAG